MSELERLLLCQWPRVSIERRTEGRKVSFKYDNYHSSVRTVEFIHTADSTGWCWANMANASRWDSSCRKRVLLQLRHREKSSSYCHQNKNNIFSINSVLTSIMFNLRKPSFGAVVIPWLNSHTWQSNCSGFDCLIWGLIQILLVVVRRLIQILIEVLQRWIQILMEVVRSLIQRLIEEREWLTQRLEPGERSPVRVYFSAMTDIEQLLWNRRFNARPVRSGRNNSQQQR